jgi:short-subunit dehydrogenase
MDDGQVVLITGGASGLGRALGEALAERGAQVILADRQLDLAESVASEIRRNGRNASAVALDVRDLPAFQRVVSDIVSRHSRIDLFLNNAGIVVGGPIERYEPKDWTDVFDVNIQGVANGIQAVYPQMIRQHCGHIVNTASMAGLLATGNMASYSMSKHAVVGVTKALRIEAKRHGVKVSALCPGFIKTAILSGGEYGRMKMPGFTRERMEMLVKPLFPMEAAEFAHKALRGIERNEPIIILPSFWKGVWAFERLFPSASLMLWSKLYDSMVRDMAAWSEGAQAPVANKNGRPRTSAAS